MLGQRFAQADERLTDAVRHAMENVKLYSDNPGIDPIMSDSESVK